jgi:TolB-like protein/DNA-binding winged helix-turn-helix (wHTH) protein/Tfp pilus assembly protein PilF
MATDTNSTSGDHFQVGDLRIDTESQTVTQNGVEIALPRLSYELLVALVRAHPRMLSNDDLISSVWAPAIVNPETVSQRVKLLKHSLGEDPSDPKYIVGVRGRGYRIAGPVTQVPPPTLQAVLPVNEPTIEARVPEPTDTGPRTGASALRRRGLIAGAVVGVVALLATFWYWQRPKHAATPAIIASPAMSVPAATTSHPDKSIVVLPFIDMSERKDQAYFADGMTEEITSMLSKVRDLRVSARTSAFSFKDRAVPVEQIGKALGVANVLEGSVRKAGDRLRITAQLISSDTGYHLWSASYDRKPADIFATQSEIARAVVRALQASLDADQTSFTYKAVLTANPEARALYFQAIWLMLPGDLAGQLKGIDNLQRAIALDPNFAQAWAILSAGRVNTMPGIHDPSYAAHRNAALDAAEQSLRLDPLLGYAHAAKANVLLAIDWNAVAANTEIERALDLDPNNTLALILATHLQLAGAHFAKAERIARELISREPLSPINYGNLGRVLWYAGKVPDAISNYQAAVAADPALADVHCEISLVRWSEGDAKEASAEIDQCKSAEWAQLMRPRLLDTMGQHAEATRAEADLERKFGMDESCAYASFYAHRGDANNAFLWLDRGYANHNPQLLTMRGDPLFKNLRSDPRFETLARRLRLPE